MNEQLTTIAKAKRPEGASLALVLGGGAARGLAHIGVIEVLEREGIRVDYIAGSSMGGLIGALRACGLAAGDILDVARGFHFPRWFLPGGLLDWDRIFPSAVPILPEMFEDLTVPLLVTAVDLESARQVVLLSGPLLPAIRATCSVPGVLPPVRLGEQWLVDGGLVNVLPVDVAWMTEPDVIVAVKAGANPERRMPQLGWRVTGFLSHIGRLVPNPATAKISLEVLVRASEIILDRQTALATAMTGPEVLIEPDVGDIGFRDFGRLDDAVAAGRRAAELALPDLIRTIQSPRRVPPIARREIQLRFDPVCAMAISPSRARESVAHDGTRYYFCSPNCRDCFVRDPERYIAIPETTTTLDGQEEL